MIDLEKQLSEDSTEQIRTLCAEAYEAYDQGDYKKALRLFYQGWVLLPKPQTEYVEAGWLLTGIGDSYFRQRQFIPGCEALRSANHCPQVRDNPFIHLRLGQCLYQIGERSSARHHLLKAYEAGGKELFSKEDPVYLKQIKELVSTCP